LIDHFLHKFNLLKGRSIQGVTEEVISFLLDHDFPGNIRELENIVEYAFISCKGSMIDLIHLPKDLLEERQPQTWLLSEKEREEAQRIRIFLDRHPRDRAAAAKALGMSRITLWRRLKKYGLVRDKDE
jgi:transcriptional regulator with PAS, ATPase and Fis domain